MTDHPGRAAPSRRATVLAVAAAGVLGLVAAVYGVMGASRNVDASCAGALEAARRVAPFARGEVAAVTPADTPRELPNLSFTDAAGAPTTLAAWRGRTVLLNLWATWCVPCRKEMPALDALQAKLGGPDFEVVAVNIDTRNLDRAKSFLAETGVNHLAYHADATARVFQDLKAVGKAIGMPTSLLVDPKGCEIAALAGPAEWASEDGLRLVNAALGR